MSKKHDEEMEVFDLILTPEQEAAFRSMMEKFGNDPEAYITKYKFVKGNSEKCFNTIGDIPTSTSVNNFAKIVGMQGYKWFNQSLIDWIINNRIESPAALVRKLCRFLNLQEITVPMTPEQRAAIHEKMTLQKF